MSTDLDVMLKRLHLANARRVWRDLVQRAEREEWSHQALLETLFAEEVAHRRGTRLARATRAAAFPFLRTVEEFDFTYQSTLRLTTIGSLLAPDFVTEGRSVILEGKPGRGKTHLAIAIAYRALQNGFEALFTTAAELVDHLSAASREGQLREALAHYVRPHVLVVDEVGYLAYGDDAANVFFHVVNERHIRRRAMIFTTNKHPKRWGAALHDEDLAEAIVDRLLERGRLLRLDGPSVRTRHLPKGELLDDDLDNSNSRRVSGTDAAEFPERTAPRVPRLGLPEATCVPRRLGSHRAHPATPRHAPAPPDESSRGRSSRGARRHKDIRARERAQRDRPRRRAATWFQGPRRRKSAHKPHGRYAVVGSARHAPTTTAAWRGSPP